MTSAVQSAFQPLGLAISTHTVPNASSAASVQIAPSVPSSMPVLASTGTLRRSVPPQQLPMRAAPPVIGFGSAPPQPMPPMPMMTSLPTFGHAPTVVSSTMHQASQPPRISTMPMVPGHSTLNVYAPQYVPKTSSTVPPQNYQFAHSGYMPQQPFVKPLKLPTFSGKAHDYHRWRNSFLQYMDPRLPDEYKMARLREAIEHSTAKDLVVDLLAGPGTYSVAWSELESWFGGADRHLEQQIREVMTQARIANERDLVGLQKYAVKLRSTIANIRTSGSTPSQELCIIATEKIPKSMLIKFFDEHGTGSTDIDAFATWLLSYVKNLKHATDRLGLLEKQETRSQSTSQPKPKMKHQTLAAASVRRQDKKSAATKSPARQQKCRKCNGPHQLRHCNEFKALGVNKRNELARLLNLCLNCLGDGHWARECESAACTECSGKHHLLLHTERKLASDKAERVPQSTEETIHHGTDSAGGLPMTEDGASGSTSFMTVPVQVMNGAHSAMANVLLDAGSSCSYVSEQLARRLHLQGNDKDVSVTVLGGKVLRGRRRIVKLQLRHHDSKATTQLEAYVMPNITSELPVTNWNAVRSQWPHLSDIEFATVAHAKVDILVGLNAAVLHVAQEERVGNDGDPIARRTLLGWMCFGPSMRSEGPSSHSTFHVAEATRSGLNTLVKKFWELESVGMETSSDEYLTPDERQAESTTRQYIRHVNGRFEVAIPWKTEEPPGVKSNRVQAECRLRSLARSLQRRPDVQVRYAKVLEDYLHKSYIRMLTAQEECSGATDEWLLPHVPVVREDKATTKVRVVFDAAAQFNGSSINDRMLTGPKLQNDLVKVLIRFCEHPIALIADISEMFLQVGLRPEDRRYHRFLWFVDDDIRVFEFTRLAFGIKASPYLAGRALLETAEKFGDQFDTETCSIIRQSFYVDDMLKSLPTEQQAIRVQDQLQCLLRMGGFHLRKWMSNSPVVMQSIPEEDRALDIAKTFTEQDGSGKAMQKALGVSWMITDDYFTFHCRNPAPVTLTKRGVLSCMASLFDPRGQIAPFTIRSKIMFQELCIAGNG